jgi:hypothetical protein
MMGHPPSPEVPLTRNEQIDLIAGNTRVDRRDVIPTQDIFYVKHDPVPNGVYFADPTIPGWRYADSVTMTIPDSREEPMRHEGINYYDEVEMPLGMNEVEVPDSELTEFNDTLAGKIPAFKKLFYSSAATLSALDDAAEYVEAALRDGLDIDLEMDGALLSAFVPVSRLDAIATIVKNTNLSPALQDAYLMKMTELIAEKTMDAMQKHDMGVVARRQIEVLREANHARIRPEKGGIPQTPSPANTQWGVTGTRR